MGTTKPMSRRGLAAGILAFAACAAVVLVTQDQGVVETARSSVSATQHEMKHTDLLETGADSAEAMPPALQAAIDQDVPQSFRAGVTSARNIVFGGQKAARKEIAKVIVKNEDPDATVDKVPEGETQSPVQMPPLTRLPKKPLKSPNSVSKNEVKSDDGKNGFHKELKGAFPKPTDNAQLKATKDKATKVKATKKAESNAKKHKSEPSASTPEPVTCDGCIAKFVANNGCQMWKRGLEPKLRDPPACSTPDSPILTDHSCESKLASICGMSSKKPLIVADPVKLEKCSPADFKKLRSSESGRLGCLNEGSCSMNMGFPFCKCKPGFSGRACDVSPAGNHNISVSNALLLGVDFFKCPGQGVEDWSSFEQLSIASNIADKSIIRTLHGRHLQFGQGSVTRAGKKVHLAMFEAPTNHEAWIDHFQVIEAEIGDQTHLVHSGFWHVLEPHMQNLKTKVEQEMGAENDLVVVGFGQGGAIANLFALYLKLTLSRGADRRISLITYGAPRVGDYTFASSVTSAMHKVMRVVRPGDPYVAVPTTSCKNYYRCLGGEITFVYYVHAGTAINLPSNSDDMSLCDHPQFHDEHVNGGLGHLSKLRETVQGNKCFKIHSFDGYAKAIAKQVLTNAADVSTTDAFSGNDDAAGNPSAFGLASARGCTSSSFKYLPAPPPPPSKIIKKLYITKPPNEADWGPSAEWDQKIRRQGNDNIA